MSDERESRVVQSVDPAAALIVPTRDKLTKDAADLAQWVNDQWLNENKTSDVECLIILSPRGAKFYAHAGTIREPEKQRVILRDLLKGTGNRYDLGRKVKP